MLYIHLFHKHVVWFSLTFWQCVIQCPCHSIIYMCMYCYATQIIPQRTLNYFFYQHAIHNLVSMCLVWCLGWGLWLVRVRGRGRVRVRVRVRGRVRVKGGTVFNIPRTWGGRPSAPRTEVEGRGRDKGCPRTGWACWNLHQQGSARNHNAIVAGIIFTYQGAQDCNLDNHDHAQAAFNYVNEMK